MTQLDFYTNVLGHLFLGIGLAGGIFALLVFAAYCYIFYPWLRK